MHHALLFHDFKRGRQTAKWDVYKAFDHIRTCVAICRHYFILEGKQMVREKFSLTIILWDCTLSSFVMKNVWLSKGSEWTGSPRIESTKYSVLYSIYFRGQGNILPRQVDGRAGGSWQNLLWKCPICGTKRWIELKNLSSLKQNFLVPNHSISGNLLDGRKYRPTNRPTERHTNQSVWRGGGGAGWPARCSVWRWRG